MTSKLKCPVCQNELRQLFNRYTGEENTDYECGNFDCDLYGIEIPESIWKDAIQKLEDLKIAKKALKWLGNNRLAENPVRVEQLRRYARNTLEQIEHKEKKDEQTLA